MRGLHFRILGTVSLAALAVAATPAYAQDDEPPAVATDQDEADQGGQNVEVTGTRIRRPNVTANVPIVSVTADDLRDGDTNVGDALNDLPSLRSTFSQSNSVRFIGTTGLNILDLRGLGIERTLVLVNSRRHITALPGDYVVDINTIPADLIERVDVITGGSSAVYGSDAVAGVVNFVLRRDFDGVRLTGQAGISQQGDRGTQFVSLTAGRNFADDRANIAINLEYANAEALYFGDRPELTGAYDGRCQFQQNEPVVGEPQAGDGVPDQMFYCGVRSGINSNGGTIVANATLAQCQSAAFGPGGANAAIGAARCLNPGGATGAPRLFRFNDAGQLLQDVPCADFRVLTGGATNNIISCPNSPVPGATLRNTGQVTPGLDRYSANLLFHFDVTPGFRPFFEAKYVHIFARQQTQPSFFASVANTIGAPNITCDNAFLDAADLAAVQAIGYCSLGATVAQSLPLNRFNVDFGGRAELITRDTYRFVAGIQGDFNEDWNYEISFNYGRVDIRQEQENDLVLLDEAGNLDGFLLAYNPVLVNGVPRCRDFDFNTGTWFLSNRADCVPVNMFGNGSPSQAGLDFINTTSWVEQRAAEYNAVAYVNGDLSQLFELPGGPIRFVIGAEWRRETAFFEADPLSASGGTFFNAFADFDPPALEVKEVFGEIEVPLLRDMPFARELTLTAAARYSDYNRAAGTVGNTFAWNVNGTWAPVQDIRFRANYSKSVRVPTLGDLYTEPTQNFAGMQDPCDINFIGGGSQFRAANCAADGVPANFVNTPARQQTLAFVQSGNPLLSEETGRSLTIGTVITPRWIPGLSITVDYYRIRVKNLIAGLAPQAVLNQCYDLATLNNPFCDAIFPRDPTTHFFADPVLNSGGVNFAQFQADGIDIEFAYRRTFENGHRLNLRAIATYVIRRNNFVDPTAPDRYDQILGEVGDPQWGANVNISYGIGPWDLRWTMNYIGKQTIGFYQNYFPVQDRPPTNADLTAEVFYPDQLYHALRLSHRVNERFQFFAGIDNIFDTSPRILRNTFGATGTAVGTPWDYVGRYFYAGATVDF